MVTSAQRFIQPTAQANTPFVPNNGNPNTVYNTTATPFGGSPTAWADIAPFGGTSLADVWSFAPASTAPPPSAFADPSARFWENMTTMAPAQINLGQSGAVWPNGTNPFIPAPIPGTGITPPPGAEDVVPDIHPHNPGSRPVPMPEPSPDVPGRGQPGGPRAPDGGGATIVPIHLGTSPEGYARWSNSRPLADVSAGLADIADRVGRGLGFNGRDGKFDAMQFLDAVTEVILPGDFYNSNVGRANWPNVVEGVLNATIPGLGKVATWLAGKLPDGNPIKEWLIQGQLQDLVDDAYNPESLMDADQNPFNAPVGSGGGMHGGFLNVNAPVFGVHTAGGQPRWGDVGAVSAV